MKILTHNAYWFQGYPSRWGAERVAEVSEVVDALTRLYASQQVDVLCLQEVHEEGLAHALVQWLGLISWLYAPGGLRPEYGGAILCRQPARLRNCTDTGNGSRHERVHLRATLAAGAERLELAAVHLPSNRYAGSPAAGEGCRVAELERVLAELPRPDLVLGDMNCQPDSRPYRFMLESGYVDAALAAGGDGARARRVDYVWLNRRCADRLIGFEVLDAGSFCRSDQDGRSWRLSDHPPLLAELR